MAESAAIWFHFPARQVQRTLEGFAALVEGETAHPAALVTGAPREARR